MNPFYEQYQALNTAYQSGALTYPEYIQAYQNLQAQEMQWRSNLVQTIQESNRQELERQALNSRRRPVNTHCAQIGNQINCQSY